MTLNDCTIIDLPTFKDGRGSLTLVDNKTISSYLPFIPKRCFWIHSIVEGGSRGEHAHRTCWEMVTPIHGSFNLTLNDGFCEKTLIANNPSKGILIPPMIWCKLWDFAPDTVCLVLASEDYDASGYINDLNTFFKETNHD